MITTMLMLCSKCVLLSFVSFCLIYLLSAEVRFVRWLEAPEAAAGYKMPGHVQALIASSHLQEACRGAGVLNVA